ncbi:MAG: hypothetical protein OEN56_02645 [Gemmatimonadota bacterium]|nr:hypothetical protein [Gemmatimonadota bacterium]
MSPNTGSTTRMAAVALAVTALAACGDSLNVNDPRSVAVNFAVSTASAAMTSNGPAPVGPMNVAGDPLTIEGTNGTLIIEEIRLIVAEVELDGEDDVCNDDLPATNDCADFEAPPRLLDLPLDGTPVEAFVGLIPPGTYEELEFEIEDLEDDEEDTEFAAEIADLRAAILLEFDNWPRKATALVVGSFTPEIGETSNFSVYIEAEIEIERELVPPLVIGEGDANPDLRVDVRPDIWFKRSDGSVLELHLYDYVTTGRMLEFELEMDDGFTFIEIEN